MYGEVSDAQLRATVCDVLRPTLYRIVEDAERWVSESRSATAESIGYAERDNHRANASVLSETLRGPLIDAELLGELRDAVDSLYAPTGGEETASHNCSTNGQTAQGGAGAV